MYYIKEMFYSIQGEGHHAGRPAVFVRFAGCNLGYRVCPWCDTDWVGTDGVGGGRHADPAEVVEAVADLRRPDGWDAWCVLTGGEPLLQVDVPLCVALHARGYSVAVETNGTIPLGPRDPWIDWVTVSPKTTGTPQTGRIDELKVVLPLDGIDPDRDFGDLPARYRYVQPLDGPHCYAHRVAAVRYCLDHPRWRLSLQIHKFVGVR